MTESEHIQDLLKKREAIAKDLADINVFRPGSIVKRFRRCGKPNCHCAQEGDEGHGPSYSLTRAENGKTITKIIPADAVEGTKEQIAEYRKFKELVYNFTEINIQMCDAKLSAQQDFSETEEAQKRGFKKHSKRKSPGKSKRS